MKQVIALFLMFNLQVIALSDMVKPAPTCPNVLKLCKGLVDNQYELIKQLEANQKALEKNLEAQKNPLIPTWMLVGASLVAGAIGGKLLLK
jgi:hypothetical protein